MGSTRLEVERDLKRQGHCSQAHPLQLYLESVLRTLTNLGGVKLLRNRPLLILNAERFCYYMYPDYFTIPASIWA